MIFLCLCLTDSLSVTRSRSIHVAANGTVSFFLTAEQYSIVYMNHIFIHSSVDGYLLFFISWKLITLQYCSGFVIYWYESALDIHVFPIPIPLPPSSPHDPSGSFQCTRSKHLSHASNLGWWSVSHLIVYLFQCYFLRTSHPRLLPQSPKVCSIHLCLFFCLAYRVIVTIFLNSMYMR